MGVLGGKRRLFHRGEFRIRFFRAFFRARLETWSAPVVSVLHNKHFVLTVDLSGLALSRLMAPFPIHVACACLTGIRVTRRKVLREVSVLAIADAAAAAAACLIVTTGMPVIIFIVSAIAPLLRTKEQNFCSLFQQN